MNNQFMQSTDSVFATTTQVDFPLRGTDVPNKSSQNQIEDDVKYLNEQKDVVKTLNRARMEDNDEAEKEGEDTWQKDYEIYQNQGGKYADLLCVVQKRLNMVQADVTKIKNTQIQSKKRETFGDKSESVLGALTPQQKTEIDTVVKREESKLCFSTADMVTIMRQLVIFKNQAMEMKVQNNELKIQLGKNTQPESTPEQLKIDEQAEADANFAAVGNPMQINDGVSEMVGPGAAHASREMSDSEDEYHPQGDNLLEQIADLETKEIEDRLGISQKIKKPVGLQSKKDPKGLFASQKPADTRAFNTFVGAGPVPKAKGEEMNATFGNNNDQASNQTGAFGTMSPEQIENERLLEALRTHYNQKVDARAIGGDDSEDESAAQAHMNAAATKVGSQLEAQFRGVNNKFEAISLLAKHGDPNDNKYLRVQLNKSLYLLATESIEKDRVDQKYKTQEQLRLKSKKKEQDLKSQVAEMTVTMEKQHKKLYDIDDEDF